MINWNDPDYVANDDRFQIVIQSVSVVCADSPPSGTTSYVYGSNTTNGPSISYSNAPTTIQNATGNTSSNSSLNGSPGSLGSSLGGSPSGASNGSGSGLSAKKIGIIVGAIVGGFVMRLLGFSGSGGMIYTILVAVAGAVLLTWLLRLVTKGRVSQI